ncbi:LysM peptidoglycan-binding domain-containing protein [Solibacillus sp. A46]|uniref:LysM peptidoglycan-binding domain-containing protein n=1 Tax=Solibacillus faecavium TaxID=2762221 RepID=A0ABR8XYQ8_9BACL|nr:LysM domain-containing protein [Solibacillus faecavium]MBD8037082.1 LysM peptidoglycan-binding domain-containing protein [Solibacillus faecavium]
MYNFFMDGVQLPVAPSAMSMKVNNKNETITLINEGEVNLLKKAGLTDIEFEVEFPNVKYPFAVYPSGFQSASYFLDHLEKLKVSQEPFQFIVNRMKPDGSLLFDTNMTVSIEDYTIDEDAENGFDIKTTISLKQFRPFGTKKLNIKSASSTSNTASSAQPKQKVTVEKSRPTTGKQTPKTYTVKAGDTLWSIAKKELGNGAKTDDLAKLNNLSNPNLIRAGQVIKLG